DVYSDEARAAYPDTVRGRAKTTLAVPLLGSGGALGAIGLGRFEVRPFSQAQVDLVQTFADQAVIAIENARLFEELQSRVDELQALGEIGQAVSSSLDLEHVLAAIVGHAVQLSNTDSGAIYEYDETSRTFQLRATHRL